MQQPGQPKSNAGMWAAIIGGAAALGGIAVAAVASSKKPTAPKFNESRRPGMPKKPCGCGR